MNTQYEDLLRIVLETGTRKADRTGTGTLSVTGSQLRYDLTTSFPLITSKRVHFKSVAVELLWMLSGSSNIAGLHEHGVTIWDEWQNEDGDLGPVYPHQWRRWGATERYQGVDQIAVVIDGLRRDPDSRRHVVSAWNVADLPYMALAPCHAFFQFVHQNGALDCVVTQRSADLFLGVPFNIASYALLTHMVAAQTGLTPGALVWNGGDCHIYLNHVDQVHQQINRDPRPFPTLDLDTAESIDDYTLNHIHVRDYFPHPSIPAPVAI